MKAVLAAIPKCSSNSTIRYAEPGEFTRRAFQNDRLDLAQVEALSDTLSAETEQQRRAAVRGNSGKLGRTYEEWRQQLLYARGELEALIDFSEDQHFDETPAELLSSVAKQVRVMLESILVHEEASHRGELLKKGIRIALVGPPNAGKSSLLNQIVGREASIVSREAGTTRDVVEVSLDIQGYLCTFADTAGFRSQHDTNHKIGEVEMEGIKRARENAANADIVIVLAHLQEYSQVTKESQFRLKWDQEAHKIAAQAANSLIIINKVDESRSISREVWDQDFLPKCREILVDPVTPIITISCRDALSGVHSSLSNIPNDAGGIKSLVHELVGVFKNLTDLPKDTQDLVGVTERQRQLLNSCSEYLHLFIAEAQISEDGQESDIVLAAEHLRSAANCLSRITGRGEAGDVEEVLGVVFEKYFTP